MNLSAGQVTFVLMATPLFSGLTQPVLARLTDKHDTRLCGPLGLAIGALCIGSIGLAQNFWQLIALQIVGVLAGGMNPQMQKAMDALMGILESFGGNGAGIKPPGLPGAPTAKAPTAKERPPGIYVDDYLDPTPSPVPR
ncbi:MAG: hypothetical protein IIC55_05005 [Proteobacteria bacterium]|nr:hypothetical protein [Pseudomonadota bacterium]